jgi:hypothetical protein
MATSSSESPNQGLYGQGRVAAEPNQNGADTADVPDAVAAMRRRTASLQASATPQRSKAGPMLTHCAWCDRIALGDTWLEREVFQNQQIARFGYRLTHGICPDCVAGVKADRAKRRLDR